MSAQLSPSLYNQSSLQEETMSCLANVEENIPQLLTEQQCKELGKQIVVIIKRLKEVSTQLDHESSLTTALSKICQGIPTKFQHGENWGEYSG